jgi:acetyl esterase/lipase
VAALAEFGLDLAPPPPPVDPASPRQQILDFIAAAEPVYERIFSAWCSGLPPIANVERFTEVIKGVDGNDIPLYIHRPVGATDRVPCVYHIHGGAMVMLEASGAPSTRWRDELAAAGLAVVGVEFRNGAGRRGGHPFPAGLNDCFSGLQWTFDNQAELGISRIIVSGESGGANLSLAVSLKAKRDGQMHLIDGVYAMCPFISNAWGRKTAELPSLYENDEYLLSCSAMAVCAVAYDPDQVNDRNPLCWPSAATASDLRGLPPHVITVNELDPLRDEGLAYYRRLMAAGVAAWSRTLNGTCHAGDISFPKAMPDVFAAAIRDVRGFADSLPSPRR